MTDALLEVNNIETFYGPIMAIRGVSFAVPRGAIVTILGANGAGKTTILKTVSGVMDAQKGTMTFDGRAVRGRGGPGHADGVRVLPGAREPRRAARGLAVGGRAADALDQPRPHGPAEDDAPGRAVARALPQAGQGHLR